VALSTIGLSDDQDPITTRKGRQQKLPA